MIKIISVILSIILGLLGSSTGNLIGSHYSGVDTVSCIKDGFSSENTTNLSGTVEYAYNMKNTVQGVFTDNNRTAFRMSNTSASLTHGLVGSHLATLKDSDGNAYIKDSFKTFYTDKLGFRHYFEDANAATDGRVNLLRIGEYYYDCHIRDFGCGIFKVDKNYHVYGDRMYYQYSLYSKKDTGSFSSFGSEIMIPVSSVSDYVLDKENGYAAFNISGVGIVGFIIPSDGSTEDITIDNIAGRYVITHTADIGDGTLRAYDTDTSSEDEIPCITFGARIYTDSTDNFDGIKAAAYEERHPLTDITVGENNANCEYVGYDALRGAYTFTCDGTDFNIAYRDPDFQFKMPITIKGDGLDRKIYVRMDGKAGCLEAAAILDDTDTLSPVDVEVCKNFQGDGGEDFYSYKDYQYGDSFVPVAVDSGSSVSFTLLNLYQNWGQFPLKQLSSIEFFNTYYHLSTGTTESNCISPYYLYGKDGKLLPDFRTRSGNEWATQPQYNSVGWLKFMEDNGSFSEFSGSIINSCGQTYADVTDYYTNEGNTYSYSLRHVEFPSTDENRTFYTLKVTFNKDVSFSNFRQNFNLFYFDGRFNTFDKMGYSDISGNVTSADTATKGKDKYYTLGSDKPFYSFYDISDSTRDKIEECFGCNFALIINSSKIISGGTESSVPFAVRLNGTDDVTSGALTLDTESISFKKGDSIEINMILLPNGTGYEETDSHAMAVRSEERTSVTASVGTVTDDQVVPSVRAENNTAEFTVNGGKQNTAVRVDGITSCAKPVIYKLTDGVWTVYDTSVHGYDGYSITTAADGTYSVSFIYNSDGTQASFRVVCG